MDLQLKADQYLKFCNNFKIGEYYLAADLRPVVDGNVQIFACKLASMFQFEVDAVI